MLTNTFCHIPTIGTGTEGRLWAAGIRDWEAFRRAESPPVSTERAALIRAHLDESARRLESFDPAWFSRSLPSSEEWRLFGAFRDRVAYLDIETTGLGAGRDHVTTIALYDGHDVFTYLHGRGAASTCEAASRCRGMGDFLRDVRRYKLLVTFNGKQFDLPFLRSYLGIELDPAHIDLRFVLASLDIRGGLKGCEHAIGLNRGELEGVDGYFAVLLWQEWIRRANPAALETLLAYNVEDVVNLETLMVHAYNMKLRETPFAETHALIVPPRPEVPFKADMNTVSRIRRAYHLP
jgi:uncharacterized protein